MLSELPAIWEILQQAVERRKQDGSQQWQDGYPNETSVRNDFDKGNAWVLDENGEILAYAALIFEIEPAYEVPDVNWLTNGDYAVVHRVAVSDKAKGKGAATEVFRLIEQRCIERAVYSIKVDTNFDNGPMLHILNKLGYTYCGEVYFRGSARKAFEKVLR